VVTTAFVGAGIVALGTAASMPDMKSDPTALAANATSASFGASDAASRTATIDRASRTDDRTAAASTLDQLAPDLWLLPLKNYSVSSPFGSRWGTLHPGVDLAATEGTPYYAAHSGIVKLARYNGGFGYCIEIDAGNGITLLYGHSSALLVHEGQKVEAGDVLGLVGNTGYSFGDHLHFEVQQHGTPINPLPFMLAHGVDIANRTQAVDN
jgi:murein DD-endopeptidase MepM/ murein hydrolase activator NlpD